MGDHYGGGALGLGAEQYAVRPFPAPGNPYREVESGRFEGGGQGYQVLVVPVNGGVVGAGVGAAVVDRKQQGDPGVVARNAQLAEIDDAVHGGIAVRGGVDNDK